MDAIFDAHFLSTVMMLGISFFVLAGRAPLFSERRSAALAATLMLVEGISAVLLLVLDENSRSSAFFLASLFPLGLTLLLTGYTYGLEQQGPAGFVWPNRLRTALWCLRVLLLYSN